MNTYPKDFKDHIYLVAYGVEGLTDHVDPEVYDAHEAFEIDKTKMKMLVSLDMNNQRIMNTNFDLKFRDIFKIINCYVEPTGQSQGILKRKSDNQPVTFSNPVVLHAIIIKKTFTNSNQYLDIGSSRLGSKVRIFLNNFPLTTLEIFENGIRYFCFFNIGNNDSM